MKTKLTLFMTSLLALNAYSVDSLDPGPPTVSTESSGALVSSSSGGSLFDVWGNQIVGFSFVVGGSNISVTSLGYLDYNHDGLNQSQSVAIWDDQGNELVRQEIEEGTAASLIGDFRYKEIDTAFTLLANTTYIIGGTVQSTTTDSLIADIETIELGTGIHSIGAPLSITSDVVTCPTIESSSAYGYLCPNMQYDVIPEPQSLALIFAGGLLLKFIHGRKK